MKVESKNEKLKGVRTIVAKLEAPSLMLYFQNITHVPWVPQTMV